MKKIYGYIYKITNKINGKMYIGQTTTKFSKRYSGGKWWKYTSSSHLKYSANKYGVENFLLIEKFDIAFTKEDLDEKEKYWIKFYNATNRKYGYNIKEGGSNGKHNKETIEKLKIVNRKWALLRKGIPRSKKIGKSIAQTKHNLFIKEFSDEFANKIQNLLDQNISKLNICFENNISLWQIDKIIKIYNLKYIKTSQMKGKFKEKHHHFGKSNSEEMKQRLKETSMKNFRNRFDNDINNIRELLDNKVSISEISRIYNCSRGTIRKVIQYYNLDSYGLNVKKYKIA